VNVAAQDIEGLRAEVRQVLARPEVREELARVRDGGLREPDVRPLYRALARHGLLAVSWPVGYGGRGAGHAEAAAVIEELVRGGVPDMLHVLSVQIVGLFLLQAGSPEQKARHLPAMAAGERYATVLYTEPEVGSDLASLRTIAVRDGDGYRITGTKVYGLKSGVSDLGLCAVRTSTGSSKYDGISLFLVDLTAPGVNRGNIASLADEQYDRVELSNVFVGADALVGGEGEGWSLLTRCLAIERTGLDYSLKAERWYNAAVRGLDLADVDRELLAEVGRHGAAVTAGSLLAWDVVRRLDDSAFALDPGLAAMAKYHTSETAQEVAVWAAQVHGTGYRRHHLSDVDAAVLEAGYREAPGLTLSAGTSQIMLDLVASTALQRADAPADPVLERLARALSGRLAETRDAVATLAELDVLAYEVPVAADGFELGLASGVAATVELGRQALPDAYTPAALLIDASVVVDDMKTAAAVSTGDLHVIAAGLDLARHTPATRTDDGWSLNGSVVVDTFLPEASLCLPVFADGGAFLALLAHSVWSERTQVVRSGHAVLSLDGLTIADGDVVGPLGLIAGSPLTDPAGLLARARVRHSGYLLGLALGAYDLAVGHARERQQFGRSIVDNQAIAFGLAQSRIALATARRLVDRATTLAESSRVVPVQLVAAGLAATEALAATAETALRVVRQAVQVHGARGLSLPYPVHAYYLAVREAATRFGSPSALWSEAGGRRLAAPDRER
jgi:alkylation response protein AidB-like acyl-CoA dehydrogenase